MKLKKKILNKFYATLMAVVMVIGLCSVPTMIAYATEAELENVDNGQEPVAIGGSDTWVNEEYQDVELDVSDIAAENQAADMEDNYLNDEAELVDIPMFKDTSSAADYMRKCFVERRSKIEFVYDFDETYYIEEYGEMLADDAIDEIHELLYIETPEPDEGDYLYWHTLEYIYEYTGRTYTDYVTFTITPSFLTTAAQEAVVTNEINTLLETEFDGWENHTDLANTDMAFWWIIDNLDIANYKKPIDATAYAGINSKATMPIGYATIYYRLLKSMGVSTRIVTNESEDMPHMWNIVGIDGLYYNVDTFFGKLTNNKFGYYDWAQDYLLIDDEFLLGTDEYYADKYISKYGNALNPYNTVHHDKDWECCNYNDEYHALYPMATNGYIAYEPSDEMDIVVTNPTVGVTYRTHVQREGWQAWKSNGAMSGTSGKALRLEGIEIKLTGDTGLDLGVEYKTHIQKYGWESKWKQEGQMSGTKGEAKRLEAIKIRLTGSDAAKYDIYYRVHAQSYGWLGWAKNGEEAGTAGQGKRLEGIEIKVVKKGEVPSGLIGYSYIEYGKTAELNSEVTGLVNYRTHVQKYGWQGYVYDGSLSGTYGEAKRLEGIDISLGNTGYTGGITYRTHIQKIGWQEWKSDGAMSGTSGKALRLEAIEIKLTGEVANHYDVYYRVHAQSFGWLDWAKNGQSAGTAGYAKRLESIQIVLVPKNGPAPGATARPFVKK